MNCINSKRQEIFTQIINIIYDKRHISDDNIWTLSHGHKLLRESVWNFNLILKSRWTQEKNCLKLIERLWNFNLILWNQGGLKKISKNWLRTVPALPFSYYLLTLKRVKIFNASISWFYSPPQAKKSLYMIKSYLHLPQSPKDTFHLNAAWCVNEIISEISAWKKYGIKFRKIIKIYTARKYTGAISLIR